MSKSDIVADISDGVLEFLEDLEWGILVYNTAHEKEDVTYIPHNSNDIRKKTLNGWRCYDINGTYVLRAPERSVCDLSELDANPTHNPEEILAMYTLLRKDDIFDEVTKKLDKTNFIKVHGPSMEILVRISSDSILDEDMRIDQIYENVKECDGWDTLVNDAHIFTVSRLFDIFKKPASAASLQVALKHRALDRHYTSLDGKDIEPHLFDGFWHKLQPAEKTLFIAKAGIPYYLGFMNETGIEPLLLEYHNGLERPRFIKFFSDPLADAEVQIIDKCYSGKTLDSVANMVREDGGTPQKVAIFPKSRMGVEQSDKILFLDEVITTEAVSGSHDWGIKLFKEIINNKERRYVVPSIIPVKACVI